MRYVAQLVNAKERAEGRLDSLREALGMRSPWPVTDVLAKLIEATEHLLDAHGCDTHGHEEYRAAAESGKVILKALREGGSVER